MAKIFEKKCRSIKRRNEIFDEGFNWQVSIQLGENAGYHYFDNLEEANDFYEKESKIWNNYASKPSYFEHIETSEEKHQRLMQTNPDYAAKVNRKIEKLNWEKEHPIEAAKKNLKHELNLLNKAEAKLKETQKALKKQEKKIAELQEQIEKNRAILSKKTT